MTRIAFLISDNMRAGAPNARVDRHELDLEWGELAPACAAAGIRLEQAVWSDAATDWSAFDAAVIGTTWDYWDKSETFVRALERIETETRLFNSSALVRWNIDKTYLRALEAAGAPVIPTIWTDRASPEAAADAFAAFGTDTLVIKPQVGAGAWRLVRHAKGDPWPAPDALPLGAAMIQPYLPGVAAQGELSLMTYGGRVSHGVRKIPKAGDFRVQSSYGGREVPHAATAAERAVAEAALAAAPEPALYARVDIAPGLDGAPLLIEFEAIEPYHYPEQGPGSGVMFAEALTRALG